ncbi:hypothetical protein EPUL_005939, partial [Erysiphe pulchra]
VMHLSITALHVVLLSILGGSKRAHAVGVNAAPNHDAFGVTNYGFQCSDRVYPKSAIYAAAKQFCDVYEKLPDVRFRTAEETGYRNRFFYGTRGDVIDQFKNSIVPILQDGTLYPYARLLPHTELKPDSRLVKNSAGERVRIEPGPDRLLIDSECNVIGAFSDLDYETYTEVPRVKNCRVIKSIQDYVSPSGRSSPEQSPPRSPQLSREPSPERSRGRSRGRSRETSPEQRSPHRSREPSPGRRREESPEHNNPTDAVFPMML